MISVGSSETIKCAEEYAIKTVKRFPRLEICKTYAKKGCIVVHYVCVFTLYNTVN